MSFFSVFTLHNPNFSNAAHLQNNELWLFSAKDNVKALGRFFKKSDSHGSH